MNDRIQNPRGSSSIKARNLFWWYDNKEEWEEDILTGKIKDHAIAFLLQTFHKSDDYPTTEDSDLVDDDMNSRDAQVLEIYTHGALFKAPFSRFEQIEINNYLSQVDDIEQKFQFDINREPISYTEENADTYCMYHCYVDPITEKHISRKNENGESLINSDATYDIDAPENHITKIQLTFTPLSPLELTVPKTVGDIEKGTSAAELNKRPLSKMIDDMLFGTTYPDIVDPSASLKYTGKTLITADDALDGVFEFTYNKGTAKVDDGVTPDVDYTGNLTKVVLKIDDENTDLTNINAVVSETSAEITSSAKLTPGSHKFAVYYEYDKGELMHTSKGDAPNPIKWNTLNGEEQPGNHIIGYETVENPHPASSGITEFCCEINVSYPVYITCVEDDVTTNSFALSIDNKFKQLPLKEWGSAEYECTLVNTSKSIPAKILSARQIKSLISEHGVENINEFTKSQVNGWYLYTWNGAASSEQKYKIITE